MKKTRIIFFVVIMMVAILSAALTGCSAKPQSDYATTSPLGGTTDFSKKVAGTSKRQVPPALPAVPEELAGDGVMIPVVMYHNILNSIKGLYIVSTKQLENDLSAYAAEGYTTVLPSEVIDYVYNDGNLPKKPILITFDDGFYNNYFYGKKIFEDHNAKALISVVGQYSETSIDRDKVPSPNYSYLTWELMRELDTHPNFEIGSHTYNLHNKYPRFGVGRMAGENDDVYVKNIKADISKLQNKLEEYGIHAQAFAYPFGRYNSLAMNTMKELNLKLFMTCTEGANFITRGNPSSIETMYRINRAGHYSTDEFIKLIKLYERKAMMRME